MPIKLLSMRFFYVKLTYPHAHLGGLDTDFVSNSPMCVLSVPKLCLEPSVVRPCPEYLFAAWAFGPAPFQKQLAFVAALVAAAVIAAVFLPSGLVRQANVPAGHR